MATHTQKHPWHMVDPSPWPAVGTVAALATAIGLIWFMHSGVPWVLALGLVLMVVTFFGWWREVVMEGTFQGHHTEPVSHGLRVGMLLFIASEVMFFFAFFWAFFHSSMPILSKVAIAPWPPKGIVPLETWTLPFFNTLVLLTSGATVTYAHHALRANNRRGTVNGLILTIALGVIFTGTQAYEYAAAAFKLKDGIYGSTFYLATGFHGAHVIIGTCFLIVCLFRAMKGHFKPEKHVGFEAAAWYWHFVDVVWIFLFAWVYWWGGHGFKA
jgi:cytochrome c oxidase subunit 3